MCGRARLSSDVSEIKIAFAIPPERPPPNIAPSWNVASPDPLPIVHYDAKDGARRLEVMRWGLIPYWAKDIKSGFSTFNARGEEVETKPAFREAFQRRRCLVPLDSFYEWKKTAAGKQPYAIALADRRLMAMAGLWETWRSPAASARAALRSSPRRRTNFAPNSTTACRLSSSPKDGRYGLARNRPPCRS